MRGPYTWIFSFAAALAIACGGSAPPPQQAEPAGDDVSPDDIEQTAISEPPAGATEPKVDRLEETSEQTPAAASAAPEPEFKEGSSVEEAIRAVPQGAERLNLDPETLGKPLQDVALYEPCKPGSARIKLRVAVWGGKAVGIDLTTTPKNPKLEECLKERIRGVSWPDKVKSLNTVEYQL